MRSATIYRLDDLRIWFLEVVSKHGYVSVFNGSEKNTKDRIGYLAYNDNDNGWRSLEQLIAMHSSPGAMFTIYVASSDKDTGGLTTHYAIGYNNITSGYQQQGAISGTPGIGMDAINQIAQDIADKKIAAYIQEEKIKRLEEDFEALRKDKTRKRGGLIAEIGETLAEYPQLAEMLTPFINGLAGRFLGNFGPAPAIAGVPPHVVSHSVGKDPGEDPTENQEEGEEFTQDEIIRTMNCMARLSHHFDDPIKVLEDITDAADRNPTKIKTALSFLQ
ncbi:MAG: hypothetical protein K1X68_13655 [Saprospiraceae bacterium]|nr:hypothetical protein [Saprospiraceae bacterium]HMW39297.1 hypothetical protein [Saprospiraceae bacterium]HMX89069.1 hypothetical protein [Saprospiraceae bacterium]HMZ40940.1 hypothetical protein [Saprospiraceae bacterium]HNC37640.1 hypothetical protein [Saprospiraceae bacterium]